MASRAILAGAGGVMVQGIHRDQKGAFPRAGAAACPPCLLYSSTGHPMQLWHLISILSLWKAIFPDYWWASSGTDKFILGKKKYSLASHSWKATHLTQGFHNSKVRKATHLFDRKIAQYIFWLYYTVSMQSGHGTSWLVCLSFSFIKMKTEILLACLGSELPGTGTGSNEVLQHTAQQELCLTKGLLPF